MNEIIYRGVKIKSAKNCRYYKVVEGEINSLIEDTVTSTVTLTYTYGSTSKTLAEDLGLEYYGKIMDLEPTTKTQKFSEVTVSLNGLVLKKLTADTHIINIVIVGDSESRVVQNYDSTTIVVSSENANDPDFINYIFYTGNLFYLQPVGVKPSCWKFKNFPKITIKEKSIELESTSDTIYTLRRRYDDYVIRAIDYQDQFILELRRILNDYGVELVRINKETTLTNTSYITYQFTQTPVKYHKSLSRMEDDTVMCHKVPIEFSLRTKDMVMFFDFKNKYNNLDLLTNFCEFATSDKYGTRWISAVKWGQITEDFNHTYQQDDNANFSYQCQFRCELYFYEVLDDRYNFLKDIVATLNDEDINLT